MLQRTFKKYTWPLLPLLVSLIGYFRWLNFNTFFAGDYFFLSEAAQRNAWPIVTWVGSLNLGAANNLLWRTPLDLLYVGLAQLGLPYNVVDKFLLMWPVIVLLPVASYLLLNYLVKNKLAASIASFVITFNTYYLAINTQGHLLLTLGAAVGLLSIYFYFRWINERKNYQLLILVFSVFALGSIDLRSLYMSLAVMGLHVIYGLAAKTVKPKQALQFAGMLVSYMVLSAYWLSSILSTGSLGDNYVLGRGLFGDQFWSLSDALALHHPFWNSSEPTWFIANPIPIYFWLIPLLAFSGLLVARKNKTVVFFAIITLIGVILAKQLDQPFSSLSQFLFDYFPGFSAFREGTKFYFFISLGYAVLIAYLIKYLLSSPKKDRLIQVSKYAIPLIVVVVSLIHLKPMIDGSIGSMFEPRQKPDDYASFDDFIEDQNDEFSRVLWVPRQPKWVSSTNQYPWANMADLISETFDPLDIQPNLGITADKMLDFFDRTATPKILESASVKYLAIPLLDEANDNYPFVFYGREPSYYAERLDAVDWLKPIDVGADNLVVYENTRYQPRFTAFSTFINIPGFDNLDNFTTYAENTDNSNFTFVDKLYTNPYTDKLITLFENIDAQLTDEDLLVTEEIELPTNSSHRLYKNTGNRDLTYEVKDGRFSIDSLSVPDLIIDGQPIGSRTDYGETIFATELVAADENFLRVNDELVLLDHNMQAQIGRRQTTDTLEFISFDSNSTRDASTNGKLNADNVEECGRYRRNYGTPTEQSNVYSDQLEAHQRETAQQFVCKTIELDIEGSTEYIFNFDYKTKDLNSAGYAIRFNDPNQTTISETIEVRALDYWSSLFRVIETPDNASSATIEFYSYDPNNADSDSVRYKNIFLRTPTDSQSIDVSRLSDRFELVSDVLEGGPYNLQTSSGAVGGTNLVFNPSFELDLWQAEYGDCQNYAEFAPAPPRHSDFASDGELSFELTAFREDACTTTVVEVEEDSKYGLTFDLMSPGAKFGGYSVEFNDINRTTIGKQVGIASSNEWQSFSAAVSVPRGASFAKIFLYAYGSETGANVVRYDNVGFVKLPNYTDTYYIQSAAEFGPTVPAAIDYVSLNPTQHNLTIRGIDGPFGLGFSDSFHDQWQLHLAPVSDITSCSESSTASPSGLDSTSTTITNCGYSQTLTTGTAFGGPPLAQVAADQHLRLLSYANGWIVDPDVIKDNYSQDYYKINPDGTMDINVVVMFAPQTNFGIGLIVSSLAIVTGLITGMLLFINRDTRKRRPKTPKTKPRVRKGPAA